MNFTDPKEQLDELHGDLSEKRVDGPEVDPVVWKKRSWLRRTLAGETGVGKVGASLKNVIKHFVPYGHQIDSATDAVGDQLKTEKRPMLKKAIKRAFTTDGGGFVRLVDENGRFSLDYLLAVIIRGVGVAGGLLLIYWVGGKLGLPVNEIVQWFITIIQQPQ
jgi:hypothetical protein